MGGASGPCYGVGGDWDPGIMEVELGELVGVGGDGASGPCNGGGGARGPGMFR